MYEVNLLFWSKRGARKRALTLLPTLLFTLSLGGTIPGPRAAADQPLSPSQVTPVPDLSDSQQATIEARRAKLKADLDALRNDTTKSDADKAKIFQKLEADYATDIAGILTPEQRAAIQKRQAEELELRKERETEFRNVTEQILATRDSLTKSLTDDQNNQIEQAKADVKTQTDKIKSDTSLSPAGRDDRMEALERGLEKRIAAILTPDQRTQFAKILALEQRQIQLLNGAEPKAVDVP